MADDGYYSKSNPRGPYTGTTRPDAPADKGSDYIEGFGTQKNLDQWAERASRNSQVPKRGE
jgi:hypothetical protein